MHRRRAIREAIVALVTGLPTTGMSVTEGRVYAAPIDDLPTLDVTTPTETLEFEMGGGPPYEVTRSLIVDVMARASGGDYLAVLDDIALEVEQALMSDPRLSGLVADMRLNETAIALDEDIGETPVAQLTMSWECRYNVGSTDPQ